MGLRRTWLVLYILFIFHFQHNLTSVSSRPSSVDTNHEALPFSVSKPDVVVFEGKARELAVVIKRGGGGGRGGGGARSGGSSRRGGGGSSSSRSGGVIPIHTGGGSAGSHRSSGSRNLQGTVCAFGWLALSVLAGLVLVQ
ncbi:unnamed protein product [Arabidopsis halleri]